MAKRGRPPHPDILTPREWEVLALLREGLSNAEIGEQLGITERGARYHVSEILSKLGVASREEAATWKPEDARRPWWARLLLVPVAGAVWYARVAVAVLVLAVAVGIGLLAWGIAREGGGEDGARQSRGGGGPSGFAYELAYLTANGEIVGGSKWRPKEAAPEPGESTMIRNGEATLVFTEYENREEIFANVDDFYVDLETTAIRRGDNPQVDHDAWPPSIPPAPSADHIAARTDGHDCSPHPCKGWRYVALYEVHDGDLRLIFGFDEGTERELDRRGLLNPPAGEALHDVTGDPHLVDILAQVMTGNAQLFYIRNGEVRVHEGRMALSVPLSDGSEGMTCKFQPCPGFAYEMSYRPDDGTILSVSVYDPCPEAQYLFCGGREAGQAAVDIADDPLLLDVLYNGLENYRVDVSTGKVIAATR
jgi:DNA-binding CsgD family transcriptional regulator